MSIGASGLPLVDFSPYEEVGNGYMGRSSYIGDRVDIWKGIFQVR